MYIYILIVPCPVEGHGICFDFLACMNDSLENTDVLLSVCLPIWVLCFECEMPPSSQKAHIFEHLVFSWWHC